MGIGQTERGGIEVEIENVGGIEETSVAFSPGVTILAGRNATNRTSLLQALMAALGSDNASLKSDADEGTVELTIDGETYTRQLTRHGDAVSTHGDPYLDDPTLADLFAFLLESNEARQAVARGDDLRDIIMEPVDTDAIQAEIDRLTQRRQVIESEMDGIHNLKGKLPSLEEERTRLDEEIEEKRAELSAKEDQLEEVDVEQRREQQSEADELLSELQVERSELDDVRYNLETEQESLESLLAEKRDLEAEEVELDATTGELKEVEAKLDRLRSRKADLETEVNELQSIIGFNEEMLADIDPDVLAALSNDKESSAVTDQLVDDDIKCWSCGSIVARAQIKTTVEQLRTLVQEKLVEIQDLEDKIERRKEHGQDLQEQQRRRDQIDRRLRELDDEIAAAKTKIDHLQERRDALTDGIEAIEADVEELESNSHGEVLDLHKEANQLEYELGKLESERERVAENISEIEGRLDERDDLETRRDEVSTEIDQLRTKIDRIEREAVEAFNQHMDSVLELLDYANLDRVWLERVESEVRDGRRKVTRMMFELHVVRSTAGGATYEDTIDNLSESERVVTGLVFALAGYLAHDLHQEVPFMLLDSVEAVDSERLSSLVDYFADQAGYLVIALLPEDAAAMDEDYERVTDI
jgi:predicted RNase H-like nuclease (RuvC/YqgF family)